MHNLIYIYIYDEMKLRGGVSPEKYVFGREKEISILWTLPYGWRKTTLPGKLLR